MASSYSGPVFAGERRDTDMLLSQWSKEASSYGGPPPITAFDFLKTSFRFVIRGNAVVEDYSFLIYGAQFARVLELPETPAIGAPLADQLPLRYLALFLEGCGQALAQTEAPAPVSGRVLEREQIELYRAIFLPLASPTNSQTRLIIGSFNRRIEPRTAPFAGRISAESGRPAPLFATVRAGARPEPKGPVGGI
jgi:hypothetical protein